MSGRPTVAGEVIPRKSQSGTTYPQDHPQRHPQPVCTESDNCQRYVGVC